MNTNLNGDNMSSNLPDPHQQAHLYGWKLEKQLEEVRQQLWRAWARAEDTDREDSDPFRWGRDVNHPLFRQFQKLVQLRRKWLGPEASIPEAVRKEAEGEAKKHYAQQMEAWLKQLLAPEPARRLMKEYPFPGVKQKVAKALPDPPVKLVEELLDDPEVAYNFCLNSNLSEEAVRTTANWLVQQLTRVHEGKQPPTTRDTHYKKDMSDLMGYSLGVLIEEYGWPQDLHVKLLELIADGHEQEHSRETVAREVLEQNASQLTISQLMEALETDPNNTWAAKALLNREEELEEQHFVAISRLANNYSACRKLAKTDRALQFREVRKNLMDSSGESVLLELMEAAPGREVAEIIERSLEMAPRKTITALEEGDVDLSAVQPRQLTQSLGELDQTLRVKLIRLLPNFQQDKNTNTEGRKR